jgi:E1A/CREB-binding protein
LVAKNRVRAAPKLPLKVTWPGRRAFQREVAARFSPEVVEKDQEMECEVFQTRPEFLQTCQRNHYQFDQLRRAKHSSMMILYHLHNPHEALLTHNCANCKVEIDGTRYECKGGCDDFHLCKPCYAKIGKDHIHELNMIVPASSDSAEKARARKRSIQLHMTLLVHASKCKDRNCRSSNCAKMKALLRHGAHCTTRANGGCPTCRRIWALLQIHARQCRITNGRCSVPRCADLKKHLRDLRMQQRRRDDRRRQQFDTGHAQHQAQLAQASAAAATSTTAPAQ